MIASQVTPGQEKPTAAQVLRVCTTAWDHKAGSYVFQVYIKDKDTNTQQIYIRADPTSTIKHSICSDGARLPPKDKDVKGGSASWPSQRTWSGGEWAQSKDNRQEPLQDPWGQYAKPGWNTWEPDSKKK